ncbi:hypothetical protein AB0F81_50290, partial [Actinoplanes sp. NPDC024001]|uniref:hypothetical protein n=1 Tax=Actinoplanes sp. NPDC024001 TaxID=3154598 RepID=UPI0033E20046
MYDHYPTFDPNRDSALIGDGSPWDGFETNLRMVLNTYFLGLLGVAGIAAAVALLRVGDADSGIPLAALGLWFVHGAGLGFVTWVRPRRSGRHTRLRAIDDETVGVTFTYAGTTYYWTVMSLLLSAAGLLPIGVLGLIATGHPGEVALGVVFTLCGLFCLYAVYRLVRRAPGRLTLTPDSVFHRGFGTDCFVPWSQVTGVQGGVAGWAPMIVVTARDSGGVRTRHHGRRGREQEPALTIRAPWLGADPEVVYRTLRHYHRNPGDRAELSGEAGRERIEQQASCCADTAGRRAPLGAGPGSARTPPTAAPAADAAPTAAP